MRSLLTSKLHDGSTTDWVYGLDAEGLYLGVVTRDEAASEAPSPPPTLGTWRWTGAGWVRHVPIERRLAEVDRTRDEEIRAGVEWGGRRWHADDGFLRVLHGHLLSFDEAHLAPDATVPIRALTNELVQMGRSEISDLAHQVLQHSQRCFAKAWAEKDALRSGPSP